MTTTRPQVIWSDQTVPVRGGALAGVRIYRPANVKPVAPAVLHLHGGSFIYGNLEAGRAAATLLAEAGAIVTSIDYPLAPEHRFPKALDTAFDVLSVLSRGKAAWSPKRAPLYVAGEEAGGNLAAGLALMARDQKSPSLAGQILLSPMLDSRLATCSVREAKAGAGGCQWADGWHHYLGTAVHAVHPYASPVVSSRLSGLAPALLITAEDDLLRDETSAYARKLRDSGVPIREDFLKAPTGWPCALYRNADPDAAWRDALRDAFTSFFAETTGKKRLLEPSSFVR
ncbi:alpha/beta hydrolase [Pseudorhodoplanes sp.]|uniref:alpha/beta hydrolase n=1 Tax=Pseudorhodoplanes sp. TaxID=1934341 RepID=UPI002C1F5DB5|nr:alpha/beta hydrolase [Pseudorhodoplanes sp.]HWV53525.1 alpha/beta hydrolase [Pseudorhodoplanes sp.]